MTTYTVTAERGATAWVFQCVEHPGAISESTRLTDWRDLMQETVTWISGDSDFDLVLQVQLPDEQLNADIADAKYAAEQLAQWQRVAAVASRRAVRDLWQARFQGSDIAAMLGISKQRVSQLEKTDA